MGQTLTALYYNDFLIPKFNNLVTHSIYDALYTCIQSNPLAHLDLVDYACQDLIVSFAVGNKEAELSSFSPKTNVTVNIGGTITYYYLTYMYRELEFVNFYLSSYKIVMIHSL